MPLSIVKTIERSGADLEHYLELLRCPACAGALDIRTYRLLCANCGQNYDVKDNIPRFLRISGPPGSLASAVTQKIKNFYETNPFPDYDSFDNVGSLIEKAKESIFARVLNEELPAGINILEAGCGTGQLSIFLSLANRRVVAADLSSRSLEMGQAFKEKNSLRRPLFIQMDLFNPCLKPESFDLVISNGVLHHTADPRRAFRSIARLVRPGGHILAGLYHKYGRFATDVRRFIFNMTRNRFKAIDPMLRPGRLGAAKQAAWFADQYKNPQESKHTIGEAAAWLNENGFDFVSSIPRSTPDDFSKGLSHLFRPQPLGDAWQRFAVEFSMLFWPGGEGGFFIVIGKKRSAS
ncbi:MAG: methyltransferase domain-containing protein [Elusimicrobia bacterium]|nr:methyltransferase domain-containing protein [Elusimicrobiota bacterium]